jgi:hypothetical protein
MRFTMALHSHWIESPRIVWTRSMKNGPLKSTVNKFILLRHPFAVPKLDRAMSNQNWIMAWKVI